MKRTIEEIEYKKVIKNIGKGLDKLDELDNLLEETNEEFIEKINKIQRRLPRLGKILFETSRCAHQKLAGKEPKV